MLGITYFGWVVEFHCPTHGILEQKTLQE